jgi:hypothetical protein
MKIRPMGAELFHAVDAMDEQTDRHITKLIVFRDFVGTPTNALQQDSE